jgi:hypothetical protein
MSSVSGAMLQTPAAMGMQNVHTPASIQSNPISSGMQASGMQHMSTPGSMPNPQSMVTPNNISKVTPMAVQNGYTPMVAQSTVSMSTMEHLNPHPIATINGMYADFESSPERQVCVLLVMCSTCFHILAHVIKVKKPHVTWIWMSWETLASDVTPEKLWTAAQLYFL